MADKKIIFAWIAVLFGGVAIVTSFVMLVLDIINQIK